ncbi:MAG: error-prone DNA polymerase [Bryobacterales bacterium]|nr:error-prone DNA polymerase [Bryobacterales bacterium]
MTDYVELHAASAFSFLEAASLPEEMAARAAELGYPAMALLDRDGFYGSPRFHLAAKKAGIRPHAGAEVTGPGGARYPLLARTRMGYQNLCRLITLMKMRSPKGQGSVTAEELRQHAGGVLCLTGELPPESFLELIKTFGQGNVYVEISRHFHRRQEARNEAAIGRARSLKIPLVATNAPRFAAPGQRRVLDVLTCVRHKVALETAGRLLNANSERYLKTPRQMARLFADLPEALANTVEVSGRLEFTLEDLGYEFPRYPVPPGETMMSFLTKRTREGAQNRYRPYHHQARCQIERELALIDRLNLAGYFLIVWDLVEFCRREGILAQGRGSAANSAVCYSLGITAVDPVGMELLFERFLSEERGEWPDIDLDLPSGDRREKVIQYVYSRYGERGAAMTANVITYRTRSAARDVGKALGFDEQYSARLAHLLHTFDWKNPQDIAPGRLREAGLDIHRPLISEFFEIFGAVQDLPRHLGQHSGGMIVCQDALDSVVPLEPATMPGRVVVQWDKDDCAALGLIKIDLLGLGMMSVMQDSLGLIHDSYGEQVDLSQLPPNDPAVYHALQTADTVGMFQVESRAQQASLPRLRPERFYDIVVQVGIIRPGPIAGKLMHPYLKRRQGREPVDYMHPLLEPVLRRTLGVPLFQEQLLRMAMLISGFTGGESEELRRSFTHKRSQRRMQEVEVRLRAGMTRKGVEPPVQDRIVQAITSFALYGFPESHAASFALLAYASAYLKCHYLAAFTCALLNNQPMGFYHPNTLIKDAQRHGLHFRPVDVSVSGWLCAIENGGQDERMVRLGLCYVKGLRAEAGQAIVRERRQSPFLDLNDFARRLPGITREEMRRLAEVGALNSVQANHRRDALWKAEKAVRPPGPLFARLTEDAAESPLAVMTPLDRLRSDFRGTGLSIGKHPMSFRRADLDRRRILRAADLARTPGGRLVSVAGCVIVRQRPNTAGGFVFLSLEDETGISNIIVNPDVFERNKLVLVEEPFLIVDGTLQNQDGLLSVRAGRVRPLSVIDETNLSHDFH